MEILQGGKPMCRARDLATIYRPVSWETFKGQSHIVSVLRNQGMTKKGLSGVYLFAGPSGVGKTTLARLFYRTLNCLNLSPTGNPCEECEQCDGPYRMCEVDAAATGGKEYTSRLITYPLMSHVGEEIYRGMLIDECHMLSKEAWALLLRPFEEVPDNAFWILATTEMEEVPENIKTRCQIYEFEDIPCNEIIERLKEIAQEEGINIADKDLLTLARHSNKNLRQAIRLLEKYWSVGNLDWLREVRNQNNSDRQDFLNDNQRKIINVVIGMATQVAHGKLRIGDIKTKLNTPGIDERLIASELRYAGFRTTKVKGVTCLVWEPAKLKKVAI